MRIAYWLYFFVLVCLVIINIMTYRSFVRDRDSLSETGSLPRRLWGWSWMGGAFGILLAMKKTYSKFSKKTRLGMVILCVFWLLPFLSVTNVALLSHGRIWFTPLMVKRLASGALNDKSDFHWAEYTRYNWVDYGDIHPEMTRAVMASEDNLFPSHNGFSRKGIQKALDEYRKTGHVKHGGSTISQQTAKNIFTFGGHSLWRKARETYYTVLIEQFWSKRRIMEVYLNVMELGDGIYGVEAACQYYYHHSSRRMSRREAALFAVSLPNPRTKYHINRPGPYMLRRQQSIMNLMPKLGPISL